MYTEFMISILAGLGGLAFGGIASTKFIQTLIQLLRRQIEHTEKPYAERLAELTDNLTKASREVDAVLAELAQVALRRQTAVEGLEANLTLLESREKKLKEKIESLEKTPLPVAEHFAQLLEAGDKRIAMRDYALFGAGVGVTTVISILIQVVVN
jgi:serine/threonine protein phosphatase PrpC